MSPRRIYLGMGFAQGFIWSLWAVAAFSWWVVDLDLSPIQLVLLGTFLEGTVLLAEVPTGVVADVYSRKWSIVAAWIVIAVAQGMLPVSSAFGLMLFWQFLWGLGFTLQSGADTAWVTDEIGEADDALVVRHAVLRSVGIVLGVSLSIGTTQISLAATMILGGLLSIAWALFLAVAMPERNFSPAKTESSKWGEVRRVARSGFTATMASPALRVLAVAMIILAIADELIDRLDIRLVVDLGLPDIDGQGAAVWFGIVWITMTLLNIPVMLLAERRIEAMDLRSLARTLCIILVVSAAAVAAMAWGGIFALALVGWVLRDVIRELIEPLAVAWTNRQAETEIRATVLSFQSQAVAAGQLAGGLALGAVAELVSIPTAFWVAAGFTLLAASIFGRSVITGLESGDPKPGETSPADLTG